MWFVKEQNEKKLLTRVMNITDVVAQCKDTGFEWFEQLLENVSSFPYTSSELDRTTDDLFNGLFCFLLLQLLKKEEESNAKNVMKACTNLVNCLVDNVLRLELTTGKE